jgi:hypothetical protein
MQIETTYKNEIKELDPRKAYKYLGIEESYDIQHKNEKKKVEEGILEETGIRYRLGTDLVRN